MITEASLQDAWLVSPLATAITLSRREGSFFKGQPHQRLVSDAIVEADLGLNKNHIIVSMPPRHGKSEIISRRTVAWYLGKYPSRKVGIAGYGANFAKDWGRKVRNDVESHEDLFGWELRNDTQAADLWRTTEGGEVWTAGINSGASGRGAHLLVMDDPIKDFKDANSPVYRENVWQEWQRVFSARVEHAHQGQPINPIILVVMTRWHLDDLAGRLLGESLDPEGRTYGDPSIWREIRLPLLWDNDRPITYTFGNGDVWTRRKGEPLCPLLVSQATAEGLKDGTDTDTWACLYQQDPTESSTRVRVYHSYEKNVHEQEQVFDPSIPLFWALDFNLNPMASVIGQCRESYGISPLDISSGKKFVELNILDEIWQPGHVDDIVKVFAEKYLAFYTTRATAASDPKMSPIDKARYRQLEAVIAYGPQPIHLYGDAAGRAEAHAGPDLSAWATVKRWLKTYKIEYIDHVPSKDPAIKDRVNAMNMALKSTSGTVHMWHDPRCKHLKFDLENVSWQLDSRGMSTGKLDPGKGGMLTHITDALGYMVVTKFGVHGPQGDMRGSIAR